MSVQTKVRLNYTLVSNRQVLILECLSGGYYSLNYKHQNQPFDTVKVLFV